VRTLLLLNSPQVRALDGEMARRAHALAGEGQVEVGFLAGWSSEALFEGMAVRRFESGEALRAFLGAERVDAIVACDVPGAFGAIQGARYQGALIVEVHEIGPSLATLWEMRGQAAIDGFIVPSQQAAEIVRLELGYDALPVEVVPYGVDIAALERSRPEVLPERPVILWAGGEAERHNWRGALEIAARVRSGGKDVELWMLGDGEREDATFQQMLALVARDDLADRCRWVAPTRPEEMAHYCAAAAAAGGCHLVTALDAPFPVTAVEAAACGCPVVAPQGGACAEALEGLAGLYPPTDLRHAVGLVERALGDTAERREAVESARAAVMERYDAGKVAESYGRAIRRIAERPVSTAE